jgi:hypothetical protein
MSNKTIWGFLALASVGVASTAASATPLDVSAGANPLGPEFIITANADGSFTTAVNSVYSTDPGPYDSVEDTYFGVVNNTTHALLSIGVSAPGAFGFEGDGIDTFTSFTSSTGDTTGYGGPDATFASLDGSTGTVFFGPNGIGANGGTDVFSLEEAIALNTLVVTSGVPEPSTWAMMILGFVGLGFMARRRRGVAGTQQLA